MVDYINNDNLDPEVTDHLNEVVDQINIISSLPTGTADEVAEQQDADTGRVTDPDGNLIRYLYRYVHYKFAEDAQGTTEITDLSAYTGSTIYLGVNNNSDDSTAGYCVSVCGFHLG